MCFCYMRRLLISAFLIFSADHFAVAQLPAGIFLNEVYSSYQLTSDIVYGSNTNFFTSQFEELKLDLYEADTPVNYLRPLLIYIHGGGFTGGDKTADKALDFGEYFSKRGYVVASINYRLGKEKPGTTTDNFQTVYMATQDCKSAVRYLKSKSSEYCLDTSAFYVTGTSAGATLALLCVYWDQEEADQAVNQTAFFGSLDTSSGNAGYSSQLNSAVICWGGITDTTWLQGETEPNLLFHGTLDPTIPYTEGYNPDSVYLYGGFIIHRASVEYGLESYLKPFEGFGHGVDHNTPEFDTLLTMTDTFLYAHLPSNIGNLLCHPVPEPDHTALQVYPNPSDGKIYVSNPSAISIYAGAVILYDITGRVIFSGDVIIAPQTAALLNFDQVSNGMYFLQLKNNLESTTSRVLISRP